METANYNDSVKNKLKEIFKYRLNIDFNNLEKTLPGCYDLNVFGTELRLEPCDLMSVYWG